MRYKKKRSERMKLTSGSVPEGLKPLGAPARLIFDRRDNRRNVLWRTEMRLRIGYSPALGTGNTRKAMTVSTAHSLRILIVEDAQETRDSIRELLTRDGYCVDPARDEEEAVDRVQRKHPDAILISLAGAPERVIAAAQRIRIRGGLTHQTPIVIFSLPMVPEGAEEELIGNIHVTVPDNFNQLRALLRRLLREASRTH